MPIVFLGQLVGLDNHAYIRGVELVVDHGAVPEKAPDTEVALDQRRLASAACASTPEGGKMPIDT